MKICEEEKPKVTHITDEHSVACWLMDPRADRSGVPFREEARRMIEKEVVLEVKNLKKYFPASHKRVLKAVDDVSFTIHKGETFEW